MGLILRSPNTISDDQPLPRLGWTGSPSGRGTLDIVWSCAITMFLCSWSILCLNVPGSSESRFHLLRRKLSLMALGILCPELIFFFAYGQWVRARQSVQDFKKIASEDCSSSAERSKFERVKRIFSFPELTSESHLRKRWTMKEAFFAEMGGFRLSTRDYRDFPLDAKQIHYLVSNGHMAQPILSKRVIEDKNKADGVLRTITLCQILWFLVNVIGRWIQRLTVTTFELTTVSFILCSSVTAFLWWRKPADVFLPENIHTDISITDILAAENQPVTSWSLTPLDFVSREEWWASKCWSNFVNILRIMHLSFGSDVRPIDRISDTQVKAVSQGHQWILTIVPIVCLSVLFAGWEHEFLTSVEQTLWRAACSTMMTCDVVLLIAIGLKTLWGMFSVFKEMKTNLLSRSLQSENPRRERPITRILNQGLNHVRNNSANKDPKYNISLRVMLPMYVIAVFYCHARAYVLIADIIELRSLPASAYATVNWQQFWPHLA